MRRGSNQTGSNQTGSNQTGSFLFRRLVALFWALSVFWAFSGVALRVCGLFFLPLVAVLASAWVALALAASSGGGKNKKRVVMKKGWPLPPT